MSVNLRGYINDYCNNHIDFNGDLSNIKYMYFRLVDEESIKKINNIAAKYNISSPLKGNKYGGLILKCNVRKLLHCVSNDMLYKGRDSWLNVELDIVAKYKKNKLNNIEYLTLYLVSLS